MSKKIAIFIPNLRGGGGERVASIWANQLHENGRDVCVITVARNEKDYYVNPDIPIYTAAPNSEEYLKLSFLQKIKKFRAILKEVRPHYVISFLDKAQIWTFLAARGLGIKRIDTVRINPWQFDQNPSKVIRILQKRSFNTCHKIIVQATQQKEYFSRRTQKKCVLIPNPVSSVYKDSYKPQLNDNPCNFIAAGRLVAQKNFPMLIRAFSRVCETRSDLQLQIFGAGSDTYTKMLQDLIFSLHMENNIVLAGRSAHIEEEYKKNDIFLMTSDYEGLPNALIEAMASRLVCISTDCKTGPRDLIEHGKNGFLFPVGDEDALVNTIQSVLALSAGERDEMAGQARQKILAYCSEESSLNKLVELLDK